jgi:general secretion pathway protein F
MTSNDSSQTRSQDAPLPYKALNNRGELLDGQMEAASSAEVVARLQDQGHLPVEAKLAARCRGFQFWKGLFKAKTFSGPALVQFTQQLATLLGAGQPLDRALTILLELPEDETARRAIADVRDAVRGGSSLSAALERQHGTFSRLYINMVRAGEAGGSLQETLARLSTTWSALAPCRAGGQCADLPGDPAGDGRAEPAVPAGLRGAAVRAMYESLDAELPLFTRSCSAWGCSCATGGSCCWSVPALAAWWFDRKRRDPCSATDSMRGCCRRRFVGALIATSRDRAPGAYARHAGAKRRAADVRARDRSQRAGQSRAGGRCRSGRERGQETASPCRAR